MNSALIANALSILAVIAVPAMTLAQNPVTVSVAGSNPITLTPKLAGSTFVASNASSAQNTLKDGVIAQAQGSVLTSVVGTMAHVPVMGLPGAAVAAQGITKVFGHGQKNGTKGFNVTFLQGLSSSSPIPRGSASFVVPTETLKSVGLSISTPVLLRIRPSAKDSARIVRSTHVNIKQTGSSINPVSMEILGTEQDEVACHAETVNGIITLTPNAPLEPGEYALAASAPSSSSLVEGALWAWDFRVE